MKELGYACKALWIEHIVKRYDKCNIHITYNQVLKISPRVNRDRAFRHQYGSKGKMAVSNAFAFAIHRSQIFSSRNPSVLNE